MKCPKCGFTSFDFLENCKKCGQDLQSHKQKFGLRSLIFPTVGKSEAPETTAGLEGNEATTATTATADTDFGFDFMSEEPTVTETSAPTETTDIAEEPAADEPPPQPEPVAAKNEEALDDFSFDETNDETEVAAAPEDEGIELADDFDFAATETEGDAALDTAETIDEDDEFAFAAAEDSIEMADAGDDPDTDEPAADLDFNEVVEDLDFSEPATGDDDLEGWDEIEESPPGEQPEPEKTTSEEARESSDPFDLRGFAEAERAPDFSRTTTVDNDQNQDSAESETAAESTPRELFADAGDSAPNDAAEKRFDFMDEEADQAEEVFFTSTAGGEKTADETDAVPLAPFGPRLAAGFCDLLVLTLVFVLFLIIGQQILQNPAPGELLPDMTTLVELSGPYFLVLFALSFGYFTLFHFLTGQTPGKMLFHLRVEDLAGQPLLFSQAFLRSVGGLFSLLPAGLGFLVIFFSSTRRGWNDLLAGSRLVPVYGTADDEGEPMDC
ncbi:hypothetical protein C2E25_13560 [Geothermobacter hydrogeniphilus]|uniref:RDD domain-containing protein n=1 Tax=Geothermobacter hydrogeniphilus TaxID=1969733 RepID=A0A2K2H7E4_9BACT|nr:RDD family protein [Geothermobacter hydrogeniphilus]PNU19234.1 hypothetical protein C2E25_13560 [Geothermobacter hydrogeniphilus]